MKKKYKYKPSGTTEQDLFVAVIEQLGHTATIKGDYIIITDECYEQLSDVSNHGAAGGFGGFIYYSETEEFFDKMEDEIMEYAQEEAEQLGHKNLFSMVGEFSNPPKTMQHFKNIMAWYALEQCALRFTNQE